MQTISLVPISLTLNHSHSSSLPLSLILPRSLYPLPHLSVSLNPYLTHSLAFPISLTLSLSFPITNSLSFVLFHFRRLPFSSSLIYSPSLSPMSLLFLLSLSLSFIPPFLFYFSLSLIPSLFHSSRSHSPPPPLSLSLSLSLSLFHTPLSYPLSLELFFTLYLSFSRPPSPILSLSLSGAPRPPLQWLAFCCPGSSVTQESTCCLSTQAGSAQTWEGQTPL